MAQTLSFVQMVFMLVPAAAPAIGVLIIAAWDWRAIFVAFAVFAGGAEIWLHFRQSETLAAADRRPLKLATLRAGFLDVVGRRGVMIHTLAITLNFAVLVAILSSTQQVYGETCGKAASFPFWFAMTALAGAFGTLLNAFIVLRIGMRHLVLAAFGAQAIVSFGVIAAYGAGAFIWADGFAVWFFWTTAVFFMVVLSFGNLYALALQPLGHIAGMAASLISAISTVVAVLIAVPIGLAFDGTPMPLISGVAVLSGLAWLVIWRATKDESAAISEN
jgi:DHA1 family bicyclomycin/chloramphenicol resistance-like MFS transporter